MGSEVPGASSLQSDGEETILDDGLDSSSSLRGPDLPRGATLGRYVLLARIGAGGMGVVYEAYDPELDRKLAIKLLHPRRTHGRSPEKAAEQRTRLLREAQAMARLVHPNVIAVHDVGTLHDRVFVAMELVSGTTLSRWLERDPPLTEKVRVFVSAGRGLAAAHQAGLVHRDFKPDNVMVGRDGRVVVMDFGLARARSDTESSRPVELEDSDVGLESPNVLTSKLTRVGAILGTPAYMAPEQHVGAPADERSDQFSFCVAMFEGLYRTRPFHGDTIAALALEISEGRIRDVPRRPRVPQRIRRALERGLSSLPEDRWPSMTALVVELDRDPNSARRRIGAGIGVVALAGAVGVGLPAALDAGASPCGAAEAHLRGIWDPARKVEIREAFLGTGRRYAADTWEIVEKLVDGWADAWLSMRGEACEATRVRGEQSEELLDRRMACLDRRLGALGALSELFAHADDEVLERAIEAADGLPAVAPCGDADALLAAVPPPEDEAVANEVERIRSGLDRVYALDAAAKYDEALGLATELHRASEPLGYGPVEAEATYALGSMQGNVGQYEAAQATIRRAIALGEISRHDELRARAWLQLVWVVGVEREKIDEGLGLLELAEAVVRRRGEPAAMQLAQATKYRAILLKHKGELDASWAAYEQALAAYEAIHGKNHDTVASTLTSMGQLMEQRGDYKAALELHQRSLEISQGQLGAGHPRLATVMHNIGNALRNLGRLEEGLALELQALEIQQDALGPEHPRTASSHNDVGLIYENMGRYEEALEHLERALRIKEKGLGADHSSVGNTLVNLGLVYESLGRYDEALAADQRALEIKEAGLGADHQVLGTIHHNMGIVYVARGEHQEGREKYELALKIKRDRLGPNHPSCASTLHNLGELAQLQGEREEARGHYLAALGIKEAALGPEHPGLGSTLTGLGELAFEQRRADEARSYLERALRIREASPTPAGALAKTRFCLARALWERPEERARAAELARRARDGYAEAGPLKAEQLAEVDAWLARHR